MCTTWCAVVVCLAGAASAQTPSPYVGQEGRDLKALSPREVADYLAGKGMGLAKAAELNGYPGPAHVRELAEQLALTPAQRAQTDALWQQMHAKAVALGQDIVAAERQLEQLFAARTVTAEVSAEATGRLGHLQGQLRQVHLQAHVERAAMLTPQQIATYNTLRGYTTSHGHGTPAHRHH